jgi:hypothetical protein
MKPSVRPLRFLGLALAACSIPQSVIAAEGDPFVFNQADLLLGVKAEGGTGNQQNILFNLGDSVAIKNNPNQGIVGNIGADLIANYGEDWFERADVLFGVFGNRSNLSPAGSPGTPPEEAGRTAYVSRASTSPGSAALRTSLSTSSLGNGCTSYAGLKGTLNDFEDNNTDLFFQTATGATIMDQSEHPVSWNNSWSVWNPNGGGAAFAVFTGGIQNSFGKPVTEVFVDVQRMVPSTAATYVTSVGIDSSGNIRLVTSQPLTAYETWALSFPALDTPAKRLATADPDNDGTVNLLEFMLNGNPGVSDPSILPDLDASGTNFVFTFNRRDDSEAGATLLFQYGSDLAGWTNAAIGAGSSVVGSATITVVENGTAPDTITVSVPKSVAVGGKLFGRLSYTQP